MKRIILLTLLLLILAACHSRPSNHQAFFDNMSTLCGQTFTGYSTFPDDPEHDFAGQLLRANFMNCDNQQIRIKFDVGEDTSRTWYITRSSESWIEINVDGACEAEGWTELADTTFRVGHRDETLLADLGSGWEEVEAEGEAEEGWLAFGIWLGE